MAIFQEPMACSTGARARPMRMEPAIIAPAVISPWMASQAPAPRMKICRESRINLENAVITPLRLLAWACKARLSALIRSQRATRLDIKPMASMASALRTAASACCKARMEASLDWASSRRVANSLITAIVNSTSAPPVAIQPRRRVQRR